MENNHSMSRVERSRREKVTRYSVRKVSFGAASVAVAAFFMFLGNGAVYAAEPNVTATDSALAATPTNNQVDENSGASDSTAPKPQADTTTPTPADASSTSVESAPASKVQDEKPAPTPVAEAASVTPAPASTTEEVEEKATPALDKKQLEDYVAEIDAKLASGSYATKTDESVATLKEHLGLAKLALTTAKSQDELTKAYRRLFMTVNSGLRSKPKVQVESPKLDTTEGKATVGKKANNTEKATESNSIANSGQHDSRNGQALDANNPFRTDAPPSTSASTDPLATNATNVAIVNGNFNDTSQGAVLPTATSDPITVKNDISKLTGWKPVNSTTTTVPLICTPKASQYADGFPGDKGSRIGAVLAVYPGRGSGSGNPKPEFGPIYQDIDVVGGQEVKVTWRGSTVNINGGNNGAKLVVKKIGRAHV